MSRRPRRLAAMDHALVAAVIGALPSLGDEFSAAQRENWLSLLRHALDNVYGTTIGASNLCHLHRSRCL